MIYVGANDGMLHGINVGTGDESWRFVPTNVSTPRLSGLTFQGFTHRYLVDGSPTAADIKLGSEWHTLLVGGLAAGGRGLFALDVTDPAGFTEANASTIALWEFTSSNDADLGLTYSQPAIIKLNDGSAGVIVGNGYNNTGTGHAVLFILNAQTGAVIRKLDTGVGSGGTPNGLSTPAVIDVDGNGTADYGLRGRPARERLEVRPADHGRGLAGQCLLGSAALHRGRQRRCSATDHDRNRGVASPPGRVHGAVRHGPVHRSGRCHLVLDAEPVRHP